MTDLADRELYRMALEALPVSVYMVNQAGTVNLWSVGAEKLTGYLRQDVLGRLHDADLLVVPEGEENPAEYPARLTGVAAVRPVSIRCKNGHYLTALLRSAALRDEDGKYLGTIRVFEPGASARFANRRQDKLGAFGCLDALTGVLNHSMIQARLKEHLNLYALYPVPFSVVCYGMDDLTKLSERYGQAAKEAALRMVANAFESGLRPTDFLGRWLNQEFLAILPECGESDVMKVAERLRKMVQKAGVEWWGDTLHATVSIGAAVVHDSDSISALVGRAEQAMRESSEAGGNRVVVIGSSGVRAT